MNGTTILLAENEVVILPEICVAHALFQLPLPMSPQCCYCTGPEFYPPPGVIPLTLRVVCTVLIDTKDRRTESVPFLRSRSAHLRPNSSPCLIPVATART
jgi:hypothetical protein